MHFKIIISFLLFVGLGIYGIISTEYVLGNQAVEWAIKYCSVLSVILAGLYSYHGTFGYDSSKPKWKNALGMIVLTALCYMMFTASFQGYILTINKFGTSEKRNLKGEVIRISEKENKNGSMPYSIDIKTEAGDTLNLKTPHGGYSVGNVIKEPLLKGSLGILYK